MNPDERVLKSKLRKTLWFSLLAGITQTASIESVSLCKLVLVGVASGGFKVGGLEARPKRGPSDDVIILSQP